MNAKAVTIAALATMAALMALCDLFGFFLAARPDGFR
jgi:hypothetical protein